MRTLLPVLLALAACDDTAPARGVGAQCDPERACAAPLLCLDGLCVERPVPPAPADATLPPVAHYDIVEVQSEDTEVVEVDDVTVPEDDEVVTSIELALGPHDALTNPSDTRLGLAIGQAAARQVTVPAAALPVAIEAVLTSPSGTGGAAACGRYDLALWVADADGAFAVLPTWQSMPIEVVAADDVVRLPLLDAPSLPAGELRYGLVFRGPCVGSTYPPWLGLDASGDPSSSFVWANVWIPGATLGLGGRWGLSLVVAVGLR